jgi:4'-phosphopantetheinyl transferase
LTELRFLDPWELLEPLRPALRCDRGRIDVWPFKLQASAATLSHCLHALSDEEHERAARFVFPHHRDRHIVAHSVLRHILARYCAIEPAALILRATDVGKPYVAALSGAISFNLAHSADRAILAVSSSREIGVDLEQIRTVEALAICRSYFFGAERDAIESAPAEEMQSMFFRYWVAKEAVLKAQGIGLDFPLDRFKVAFEDGGSSAGIESLDPQRLDPAWRIRLLDAGKGWAAAICASGCDWRVNAY